MKKYISIALLIVLTVSLLAGCRKNVGEETLTTENKPSSTSTTPSSTAPSTTNTKPTSTQPSSTQSSGTDSNNNTTTTESGRSRFPSGMMD